MPQVTVDIDGREIRADAGELIIAVAEANGTYIPRFCWHPRMNPVGMCRMCLVEIDTGRGPLMTTACTNNVADGMKVVTNSPTVKKAQEGILEFLLINHPLDCPVCDRGGECPLQDQTIAYGPGESRFVEEKRHFEKPIAISELVLLDRERCILCARCTRFSKEISGDPLIEFQDRGYGTQVNIFPEEPFRSYFSGNTVQICPVGALTAVPYRFRARPWDLRMVESCSVHDTVQSRISIQGSQNRVLRCLGIDHDGTNQGWLTDKERFGFEHVNSPERLQLPLIRGEDGEFREASWAEAMELVAIRLRAVVDEHGGGAVAALGGARGTNEDAYALSKFLRVAVGTNHVDCQLDDGLDPRLLVGVTRRARIAEVDTAGVIVVWGPDLKEELGTLYLRVRRAAQESGVKLIVVHPRRTGLHDRATWTFDYRPGEGPEALRRLAAGEGAFADARAALDQGPVVALVGRTGYTEDPRLAEAVAAFILSLPEAKVLPLVRRANTYGALDMGLAPSLLPGRVAIEEGAPLAEAWGTLPETPGLDCRGILQAAVEGTVRALILVGADPGRDVPDGALARSALESDVFLVALDQFLTDSSRLADVVLPAEGFAEKDGTVTNLEGRVQRVNRVVPGPGQSRPDWSVLDDLATRMGYSLGLVSPEAIAKEIALVAPAYAGVTWDLLDWEEPDGVVVPHLDATQPLRFEPADPGLVGRPIPIGLHIARVMYDDGVLMRQGLSLHRLAPGAVAHLHPDDVLRLRVKEGDPVRLITSSAEVDLPAKIDGSLRPGVVYVPFNQPGIPSLGADPHVRVRRVD